MASLFFQKKIEGTDHYLYFDTVKAGRFFPGDTHLTIKLTTTNSL